ncbi:MAG TPA: peroxiredoxin [Rhodopseudomonas sp.]|uniref:peroxiredoxin n=1 Tax=Rhodopseudomonas sp. TaxID=1078 RepID=UPI002EDAFB5F
MSKQTRNNSSTPATVKKTAIGKSRAAKSPAKKPAAKPAAITPAKTTTATPAGGSSRKPAAESSRRAPSATIKPPRAKAAATKAPARAVAKPTTKPMTKPAAAAESPAPRGKSILAEGDQAPGFELRRDGGGTVSLQSLAGRKLVIFFYPRASTPGCTKEAIDFTRLAQDFAAAGIGVLGLSADSQKAQDSFRDKYQLTTPLLSDETHQVLEAYGVWGEKSMYGKVFYGIVRTTVLIGADGRVAKIWRNVKVDGHADEVLAVAIALE